MGSAVREWGSPGKGPATGLQGTEGVQFGATGLYEQTQTLRGTPGAETRASIECTSLLTGMPHRTSSACQNLMTSARYPATQMRFRPQAFRHSYGLSLEWRFWEPLVLMIDEVRPVGRVGSKAPAAFA
mgnify:CR=1 FL=1